MTLELKKELIEALLVKVKLEHDAVVQAAQAAHEAATHAESKPEDQYDTRGLEASYLAGAQSKRANELARQMNLLKLLLDKVNSQKFSSIAPGCLVALEINGKKLYYFLIAEGGGVSLKLHEKQIQVITPQSPLGDALLGRQAGEAVEVEVQGSLKEYEILEFV